MTRKIKLVKEIRIVKEEAESNLMAVKASGIAVLKQLFTPALVTSKKYEQPPEDGIFELDFVLGTTNAENIEVDMEVDVVFRFNNLPSWVKAIKVNATENSDIELI
ncbi:MAG: hypothetical protein R2764_03260 [Bacteroidales bacterium]